MSAEVKTSCLSTHRATKLFKWYLRRVRVVQKLKPLYCPKKVEFCQRLLTNYAHNKAGFNNFFLGDEAWGPIVEKCYRC